MENSIIIFVYIIIGIAKMLYVWGVSMKKIVTMLLLIFSIIFSTNVFAGDLNIKFENYGWYEDDIYNNGKKEKVWIVPYGGSYRVDKENSSIDMNSFSLYYEMVDVFPEPEYYNGRPIYSMHLDVGTQKGLEWYGQIATFIGSGRYDGPDTEYFFGRVEMIYVDTGDDSDNLTYSDFANGIFSGKYPMTDPMPKDFYCLTATKKGTMDEIETWYFKVLPYEYAVPVNVNAGVFGNDVSFNAYNIKGYNYIKIRDMAAAFKGTDYAFNAQWDEIGSTLRILTGEECKDVISTEIRSSEYAHAVHSNGGIICMNDEECASKSVECYNINGYNYYKTRDIADLLGFCVNYNSVTGKIEFK